MAKVLSMTAATALIVVALLPALYTLVAFAK